MDTATTPKPCRLIAYIRVSTKKQGQSGLGLEAQEAAIAAHVAFSGCVLVKTYQDVESGKRNARPGLALAIAHAKRLRALVIAKIDRLARNVAFVANLMESKVKFVACDMPQANDMTIHIIAALRAVCDVRVVFDRIAFRRRGSEPRTLEPALTREVVRGAELHAARLCSGECNLRALRDRFRFTLSDGRDDVDRHIVRLRHVARDEFDLRLHKVRDERDVTRQPIDLRDD